jgi:hypothetical protein
MNQELGKAKEGSQSITCRPVKPRHTDLDHLDFILSSTYDLGLNETFPEKVDVYFQPQTVDMRCEQPTLKFKSKLLTVADKEMDDRL